MTDAQRVLLGVAVGWVLSHFLVERRHNAYYRIYSRYQSDEHEPWWLRALDRAW